MKLSARRGQPTGKPRVVRPSLVVLDLGEVSPNHGNPKYCQKTTKQNLKYEFPLFAPIGKAPVGEVAKQRSGADDKPKCNQDNGKRHNRGNHEVVPCCRKYRVCFRSVVVSQTR